MTDLPRAARDAVPPVDGSVALPGLEQPAEVIRDPWGVPHIRARSTHDVFFAQGFVHAQDRLWQMQCDRMRAAGRLAEYLGPAQVTDDAFMRRLDLPAAAQADVDALDDEGRAMLEAYAAGVNAFIDTMAAPPLEFQMLDITIEPWRVWDPAATLKVRHALMGTMPVKLWRERLRRALGSEAMLSLGTADGRDELLITPVGTREVWRADHSVLEAFAADARPQGSNNWALHGSRTASGKPLLAGDPHRTLEVPNVYYQNRIAGPDFDAIGLSMPGIPGLFHFGHNATVAWCITHAMADTQDLFLERAEDVLDTRTETIEVRGADPVTIEVARSANGPIVFGDAATGTGIALRWNALDRPATSLGCIPRILRATTVVEMDEAMRGWVDPCNSLVMGDVHGSIGYLHRGRVPVRHRANAYAAVPGWTGEHDWREDVPFDELPRLRDPDGGIIVTANNRVVGADFPHYLGTDYSNPNRGLRILERLQALTDATVADMESIHADRLSLSTRPLIEAAREVQPTSEAVARAKDLLLDWDGTMDPDSAAAAVCGAFRDAIASVLVEREPFVALREDTFPDEPDPTPLQRRLRAAAHGLVTRLDAAGLTEAMERAVAMLGPIDDWRWDAVHITEAEHPLSALFPDAASTLDPPHVGIGGEADCVQAGSADVGLGAEHTSVARYVFDVGDWDASTWVVPLGSSGHPGSPHYVDQVERWRDARTIPMTYSWGAVEATASARQVLEVR